MAPEPPRLAADPHTDSHIAEAIRQVSADRIRQTIEKLVSFGNRSTISAQDEESIKAGKRNRRGAGVDQGASLSAIPRIAAAAWK